MESVERFTLKIEGKENCVEVSNRFVALEDLA
jgi:hypothetical protein